MKKFKTNSGRVAIGQDGREKKVVKITTFLKMPQIGQPAILDVAGTTIRTSPVVAMLLGSQIYIETKNTIYCDSRAFGGNV